MAGPDRVVELEGVTKRFGTTVAVDGVSLAVQRDEIVALLGPSGCGKTTLLRTIAGFEPIDAGRITIAGVVVDDGQHLVPPERRRVGIVFQDYALFPHIDVRGNVAFGLPRGSERNERVAAVLETVGLQGLETRLPHQLSGGQQQRVALARALAPEPRVLLLDEPFSNLDTRLRVQVRTEVRSILRQFETAAIFVTHDQEEAFALADRVAVMWEGRILQVGTPQEIYRHPATHEVAAFVGDADFLPGSRRDGAIESELGRFEGIGGHDGDVELMVRPECVLIDDDGTPADIIGREFYGHDQALLLRLPSGREVRARLGPADEFDVGTTVRVRVVGEPVVFPSPAT